MQILLITREPPLAPDEIATGNAIRTRQLESALQNAGYQVAQIWLASADDKRPQAFHSRDQLRAIISLKQADIILVAYWELLSLLPFDMPQPVILDFIAPRPLELLFQQPERVSEEILQLQRNLSKCDLILVGNQSQRNLLWFTLLQAGFDLRGSEPVLVVPLAAEPTGLPLSDPEKNGWTLVSGGVSWPWRKSDEYWQAIRSMTDRHMAERSIAERSMTDRSATDKGAGPPLRLVLFGGQYKWHTDKSAPESQQADSRGLAPYEEFSRYLSASTHIGLEVAKPNIERRFSQSFRSIEFLRHGLPLICNDYLPIACLIEHYEAGWTISDPSELDGLITSIMQQPDEWRRRSDNARQLVAQALDPAKVARPLLKWLELPAKAPRLPASTYTQTPAVLDKVAFPQRLQRQWQLLRRAALRRAFAPASNENILLVTRRDLFPADHGAAVKIVETATALSRQGRKVGIVSDNRRHWWLFEDGRMRTCRLPLWLRLFSLPGPLARLMHLSKDLPESNAFLYLPLSDNSFFWHSLYVGKKLQAGILQAEFPAYAKPCIAASPILNAAVVLVEHNVEYNRLQAQLAEMTSTQFEALRAIEVDLCNRSDAVICVSDNDRQTLLADGVDPALLHTIPHGYDPQLFALPAKKGLRQQFALPDNAVLVAFHGTFSYPPNRDALNVFARHLLPALDHNERPFHVIAIGRNPPADSPHPNIHFTGSVAQVGPWLRACDLAVIPLREGGGTRMKIIDCFAAGLPVISTSKGIEGIPVMNGVEAEICDDWGQMAQLMVELSESESRRASLADAASEFAAGMDWNSIAKRYMDIFSTIKKTPQ